MNLEKARQVLNATEWSGDMRVNFMTVYNAGNAVLRRLEELESFVDACGLCDDEKDLHDFVVNNIEKVER